MRSCQTALGLVTLSLALAGCKPNTATVQSTSEATAVATRTYEVKGTVLSLKPEQSAVVIEHEEIPEERQKVDEFMARNFGGADDATQHHTDSDR